MKIKNIQIFSYCLLFTIYYLLLTIWGCGLNNPFVPPKPPKPTPPELRSPANGAHVRWYDEIIFLWKDVAKVAQYEIEISRISDFNILDDEESGLPIAQHKSTFTDTIEYFWRVRVQTKTYKQWSDWSEVWSFKVDTIGGAPPLTPYNPSPPDRAVDVGLHTVLSWMSGDPDHRDTVAYNVYLGTDSLSWDIVNGYVEIDGSKDCPTTLTYLLANPLSGLTTYFWKIDAADVNGATSGPVWTFITGGSGNTFPDIEPPVCPGWVYADEECVFKVVATDPEGDNISYKLKFGDGSESDWTSFVPSGDTVKVSHIYRRFHEEGLYFIVRARAMDNHYNGCWWSEQCSVLVKANSGACAVADYTGEAVKISTQGSWLGQYEKPVAAGFQPSTITIDPVSASIWCGCWYQNRVYKISPRCTILGEWGCWSNTDLCESSPTDLEVAGDGDCWVCCSEKRKILKLNKNTGETKDWIDDNLGMTIVPLSIALDEARNTMWVGEVDYSGVGYVSKFDLTSKDRLCKLSGFTYMWLALNPEDGYCWAADAHSRKIVKISPDCEMTIVADAGFHCPSYISLYPAGGYAWIADSSRIIKLSFDGDMLYTTPEGEFEYVPAVEVDLQDGSCWATDGNKKSVTKLDFSGIKMFEIEGFGDPVGVAVNPNPDP